MNKHDYLGEYTGELISHREADKRGKIYDRANSSFLFDLNDQASYMFSFHMNVLDLPMSLMAVSPLETLQTYNSSQRDCLLVFKPPSAEKACFRSLLRRQITVFVKSFLCT